MTHYHTPIFCIVSRVDKRYILYNTPDTGCLECYRPHASVDTTTPAIDRNRNMPENTHTIYAVKIVNKRPRNLLNKIQNVFINGKQVKTGKITQIIPWFSRFYATKSTGNSQRGYSPTNTTGVNTDLCTSPVTPPNKHFTLQPTTHGCGQLADGLKVGSRDISKFSK